MLLTTLSCAIDDEEPITLKQHDLNDINSTAIILHSKHLGNRDKSALKLHIPFDT